MRKINKIWAVALALVIIVSCMSVQVFATQPTDTEAGGESETSAPIATESDKPLGEVEGSDTSMSKRIEYALQGTVTGMLMVFAVLAILCLVVTLSRVIFYDVPRKARENAAAESSHAAESIQESSPSVPAHASETAAVPTTGEGIDDGVLAAVITAAIYAAIESGELGDELASGFRVVSFRRAGNGQWNKK